MTDYKYTQNVEKLSARSNFISDLIISMFLRTRIWSNPNIECIEVNETNKYPTDESIESNDHHHVQLSVESRHKSCCNPMGPFRLSFFCVNDNFFIHH